MTAAAAFKKNDELTRGAGRFSGKFQLMVALVAIGSLLLLQSAVESHSLPPMSQLLEEAGLGKTEISAQQQELVKQIGELYAEESDVHDKEEAIFNQIKLSMPDAKQKNALRVGFNKHYLNLERLERLKSELKSAVDAQAAAASAATSAIEAN